MYIRESTNKYKDRIYNNYQLVESIRTGKGPRQKVICSLGDLSPRSLEEWYRLVHKIKDALDGQGHLFKFNETNAPDAGLVEGIAKRIRIRIRSGGCDRCEGSEVSSNMQPEAEVTPDTPDSTAKSSNCSNGSNRSLKEVCLKRI